MYAENEEGGRSVLAFFTVNSILKSKRRTYLGPYDGWLQKPVGGIVTGGLILKGEALQFVLFSAVVSVCCLFTERVAVILELFAVLGVFSEGVVAFCAAEELGWGFVAATSLHLPNISQVVSAFWAFHLEGWHRVDFLFLFAYNRHSLLDVVFDDLAHSGLDFPA